MYPFWLVKFHQTEKLKTKKTKKCSDFGEFQWLGVKKDIKMAKFFNWF
jgi:hypothetical protein